MWQKPKSSISLALAFVLGLGLSSIAQAAEKVPLVVLPTKPAKGIDLSSSVRKVLEPALARGAEIVPYQRYLKAASKRGIAAPKMVTKRAIKNVGAEVGARAALIVEGIVKVKRVGKKRRKKKSVYARVALIDVSSGRLLFTQTYAVNGRSISNELAGRIAEATGRHLKKIRVARPKPVSVVADAWADPAPAKVRTAAPEPPPVPEPEASPKSKPAYEDVKTPTEKAADPWAVSGAPVRKTQDPWSVPSQPAPAGDAKANAQGWGEPAKPAQAKAQAADPWAQSQPAQPAQPVEAPVAKAEPAAGWGETQSAQPETSVAPPVVAGSDAEPAEVDSPFRPALRFSLGGASLRRQAAVPDPQDLGLSKLDYGLGDGWVFSPGASAMLDVYPLRFAGMEGLLSGLGLSFDGSFFVQSTQQVDTAGGLIGDTMTSQVMTLRGGLVWSLGLWDENTAPVVSMEAGYHHYAFPLEDAPFPGVAYSGPYGALEFALPVAESAALCLSAVFTAPLSAGSDAAAFGVPNGGYGFGGGVELFISFASLIGMPLELRIGGDYDSYTVRFSGESSFQGVNLLDAELRDVAWQGYAALGFSL